MTIVAAWISAETGVGPSIASGSQTYSGNCALLPQAPMKKKNAANCASCRLSRSGASCTMRVNSTVSSARNSTNVPSRKPRSPMRLTMKAFLPAAVALGFFV